MFELEAVSVLRQGREVVRRISLAVPSPGVLALVGPGGAGKSSLLAALANTGACDIQYSGNFRLDGESIKELHGGHVIHVPQHLTLNPEERIHGRLMDRYRVTSEQIDGWLRSCSIEMECDTANLHAGRFSKSVRRALAVLAALSGSARLYLVDEPTAELSDEHRTLVRNRLIELAETRMVVLATHDRGDCIALNGHTVLLSGGAIQEFAPSRQFFDQPMTAAGKLYVETGNCAIPAMVDRTTIRDGIWWLPGGLLGGMSRPGLIAAVDRQADRLKQANTEHLICLEESCDYPITEFQTIGIHHHRVPMPDMSPPTFDQAVHVCRLSERPLRENRAVVVHCRGGLGRTGTVLAAILIWHGDASDSAITRIRAMQPKAIQSSAQIQFLHDFAARTQGWRIPVVSQSHKE